MAMPFAVQASAAAGLAVLVQSSPTLPLDADQERLAASLMEFGITRWDGVRHNLDHWVVRVPALEGGRCDLTFDKDFKLIESDCP